jgi:hypothetical protein
MNTYKTECRRRRRQSASVQIREGPGKRLQVTSVSAWNDRVGRDDRPPHFHPSILVGGQYAARENSMNGTNSENRVLESWIKSLRRTLDPCQRPPNTPATRGRRGLSEIIRILSEGDQKIRMIVDQQSYLLWRWESLGDIRTLNSSRVNRLVRSMREHPLQRRDESPVSVVPIYSFPDNPRLSAIGEAHDSPTAIECMTMQTKQLHRSTRAVTSNARNLRPEAPRHA